MTGQQARKVRWSRRVACGHYVLTGQVIIGRGRHWICRDCALAAIKTSAGSPDGYLCDYCSHMLDKHELRWKA